MNRRLTVDIFVEDQGHEQLLLALVRRIAREEGKPVELRIRSAIGGRGRTITEFRNYQVLLAKGELTRPDLIVVGIDANCQRFAAKKSEVVAATRAELQGSVIVACPDPHVERWYMADALAFQKVVGKAPSLSSRKCVQAYYKRALAKAVQAAGHLPTLGGIEFGPELAEAMDLYAVSRKDRSLRAFVDDLRMAMRRL